MKRTRAFAMLCAAFAAGVTLIGAHAEPLVIYNPSQSVPSGFYLRTARTLSTGDFVTIASVRVAPDYAALRGFADSTDRFLKRVAAMRGQTVCAEGAAISINGEQIAERTSHDGQSRPLPTWSGCRTLGADEVFLLGDTEDSFDGRYWGPTPLSLIDGVWTPL